MLITWARHSEVPIIFIQHTDSHKDDDFAFGKPGWDLYDGLLRQPDDKVIQKQRGMHLSNGISAILTGTTN